MELVFLLQRNRYFIEQAEAWYRLESDRERALALALLPLRVVDEFELIEQPHQRGFARLHRESEDRAVLALTLPDGTTLSVEKIGIDESCLVRAIWLDRPYRDGWMPAAARIELEGVRRFSLQAYLPPKAGADFKTLTVRDETSGTEASWELARDDATPVPIVGEPFDGRRTFSLRCEPEAVEDSSDARPLGFVLLSEDVTDLAGSVRSSAGDRTGAGSPVHARAA